jgi:peptidoglycan/LPS O-acetylase OafA/YrhL
MFGLLAQYQVPSLVVVLSMVVLAASCLVPDEPPTMRLQSVDRCALLVLGVAVAAAICAIVYIAANALRAPRIDQLTPRYFLPLVAPVLVGALPSFDGARHPRLDLAKPFVQIGLLAVLVITIIGLAHSFYGPSHVF